MEGVMQQYRLSYLDDHGREVGRFEFRCSDDEEAALACDDLAGSPTKDLWCGDRLIRSWGRKLPPPSCDTFRRRA